MSALIVIPARYASSRYPGKPLVALKGASGVAKSLIERSWDAACSVSGGHKVVVATDDARIAKAAEGFGAEVVMTSSDCRNGTERCADAYRKLGADADIVVNLQGDAPLTPPWFVEALIDAMAADVEVATPVLFLQGGHSLHRPNLLRQRDLPGLSPCRGLCLQTTRPLCLHRLGRGQA